MNNKIHLNYMPKEAKLKNFRDREENEKEIMDEFYSFLNIVISFFMGMIFLIVISCIVYYCNRPEPKHVSSAEISRIIERMK